MKSKYIFNNETGKFELPKERINEFKHEVKRELSNYTLKGHKLLPNIRTRKPKKKKITYNMNLYDENGLLKKYSSPIDILNDFFNFRLKMYEKRKQYYLKLLENRLNLIGWKIKFIEYVINGKLIVFENKKARSKENVIQQLEEQSFPKLSTDPDKDDDQKSYSYLTGITIFALTEEERKKLEDEYTKKLDEFVIRLGINEHYKSMSRGVLDIRDVIYFFSVVVIFNETTILVLLSRKWKKKKS
jgi:hypothetical protein